MYLARYCFPLCVSLVIEGKVCLNNSIYKVVMKDKEQQEAETKEYNVASMRWSYSGINQIIVLIS